jgi:hypothetical protein
MPENGQNALETAFSSPAVEIGCLVFADFAAALTRAGGALTL